MDQVPWGAEGGTVEVVELARAGVTAIAARELPLFDAVAQAWLAGTLRDQHCERTPSGGTVRIGIPTDLDIVLVFDVITGALATVLGDAAYAGLKGRRRWWTRRRAKPQPRAAIVAADRPALHAACIANGQTLGLSKNKAKLLADSVFGPQP